MANIEIPASGVDLPIYHGTKEETLQIGVGHLENTSLPIGGENTHAGVSSQTGRPYSRGPVLSDCLRKLPDEPKMRKSFDSPQGIWVSVFRLKDDG